MYFDRFDIVTAHYLFCSHYHDGQDSGLYARLCRIQQYFTPGLSGQYLEGLNENARAIYDTLVDSMSPRLGLSDQWYDEDRGINHP